MTTSQEQPGDAGDPNRDLTADGDPAGRVADLVDGLEEEALAEDGEPQDAIADDAARTGTDRAAEDAEPPA